MKKKVDSRIRTLIQNGVRMRHRSLFVIVGDRGKEQVVNLHYMLSKAVVGHRPSVLWCYKKELGFITHRKKRMQKIQRDIKRGIRDVNDENPFELFIAATDIRYTYYRETHKVLGHTYGMCVLQDFAALTPNLLARTVETVEGGGIVVLLLKSLKSLRQLYAMSMDVHARYRTESHQDVVGRFNERFMLSLADNRRCLVVDDELNILPISTHARHIKKLEIPAEKLDDKGEHVVSESYEQLQSLVEAMKETQPVGALVAKTRTLDQAKAVLTFVEAISEKTLRSTVTLTAARGRGKSAAMGIAMAGAVAYGYSNIFVTSPTPENLKTLFEMLFIGFDALDYKEHLDYEIVQSTNPAFNKAIVRVNVFREHRQTIQYIQPQDHFRLSQAELLLIDEAAAIPLPMVKKLMGNYLVFMSSTVNGYEGTGRSLSLKLIKELRHKSNARKASKSSSSSASTGGRTLREITLKEPIRYGQDDVVEQWLNSLLCLDCADNLPKVTGGVPHPSQCDLFYVNRDTLFSYHKASEMFLQQMMSLYVSSHYKNTPNDLQLISDAPAHHLFVLLGPLGESGSSKQLPDILCVIQVCFEGAISRQSVLKSLSRGKRESGDLIPWCVSQQFQDNDFASLSGARIVRIATHPDYQRMGYATRALQQVRDYFDGKIMNLNEVAAAASSDSDSDSDSDEDEEKSSSKSKKNAGLLSERIAPRRRVKPLLEALSDRPPETLHYLGVSYGLTLQLFNFWKRNGFEPVYMRQTANDLTGEHTCIMLSGLNHPSLRKGWLSVYQDDFQRRFLSLLASSFRSFSSQLALSVAHQHGPAAGASSTATTLGGPSVGVVEHPLTYDEFKYLMNSHDLRRLESYSHNLIDYHLVIDLIPTIARWYFLGRLAQSSDAVVASTSSASSSSSSSSSSTNNSKKNNNNNSSSSSKQEGEESSGLAPLSLSFSQSAIMLAIGLQHKSVSDIEAELGITATQVLALFNKSIRKISKSLRSLEESDVASSLPDVQQHKRAIEGALQPLTQSLAQDLSHGAKQVSSLKKRQSNMLEQLGPLDQFAIKGDDESWQAALGSGDAKKKAGSVSIRKSSEEAQAALDAKVDKRMKKKSKNKKRKSEGGSGSSKKRRK
eukprot:TRINITY_DN65816_c7_g2_i1.p1 TRINITY_DN65816_c7_g2~~TRINITY_DN65816_c7_g2_i1.p1  ORF type:complete len:1119 (-),score=665.11 TRINITY_DN65816_c7_g2_i1:99-3455(-)